MSRLRCAVVGAGIAGAATAYALARRGARVALFDRFAFCHRAGSSHGATRLLRLAYFEHPAYTPLARASLDLWRVLETDSGRALFVETGLLQAGPPEGFVVGGARRAAALHGLDLTTLSRKELSQRFPWLTLSAGDEAVIESEAGYLRADRALGALISLALSLGTAARPEEEVLGWTGGRDGVALHIARGRETFDRLVVCAGAWAAELLGSDIAPVRAVEKSLFWTAAGDARFTEAAGFMPFAIETPDARMFYGFPAIDDDGVKVGEHTGGAPLASPSARTGAAGDEERRAVEMFLRASTPGLPARIGREETCLYEMSPDGDFLIGRHPEEPRVAFAAGLSGHGFKFAPAIGEALAALAYGEDLPAAFGFLDATRARKG